MGRTPAPRDPEALVQMGTRVRSDLWLRVRRVALDRGTSAQEIVAEALQEWLERHGEEDRAAGRQSVDADNSRR